MSLEPLQRFDAEYKRSVDPGLPPKLEWLSISSLTVNTDYQRAVTAAGMNTIKRIMDSFHWSRFSPVIVRRVPGLIEIYEIIDGQHRTTAAMNCGYERVPAMIVHCTDQDAARIFAAVNGNVTPMQPISVYKAALAGSEQWATECRDAAKAAGCQILTRPTPHSQQKPLQTQAIAAVRNVWRQHGPRVLEAAFRLLAAGSGSDNRGYLSNFLITRWSRILASRPGWVENIAYVCRSLAATQINLSLDAPENVERKLEQRIGDGRAGAAVEDLKGKVAYALERRMSAQMIAASLRLPYAEVNRLIEEIRADTPKLEARS